MSASQADLTIEQKAALFDEAIEALRPFAAKPSPVKRETRTEVSVVPGIYGAVHVRSDGAADLLRSITVRAELDAATATLTEISAAWKEMGK